MKPKLFLEDVGQLVSSVEGKNIWKVKELSTTLPKNIYVVDFPGRGVGQEFLLSRHVCGPKKFLMIKEIGHTMIRLFKDHFTGRVGQFIILWGGRPLDMLAADPPLYEDHLIDTTYLKLTRVEDKSDPKGWKVVESSRVGEYWKNDTWLIMEECIASGRTLAHFVKEAFKIHKPKKLFVFPVCASREGLEEINESCKQNGVEFIPVLNSAIIEVAKEGVKLPYTDLGLRENTIVTKDFYLDIAKRYDGKPICWVGDIGDSMYKTHDYMIETLEDLVALGFDLANENFDFWNPSFKSPEFLEKLKKHNESLYNKVLPLIS